MSEDDVKSGDSQNPAAGDDGKEQVVPVSVVQALREELRELKDTNQVYRTQIMAQQQTQSPRQPVKTPLDDIADDDVLTGADFKKALGSVAASLRGEISQTAIQAQLPDMQEVISKHLPKVLEKKPHLAAALNSVSDPGQKLLLAYEFGTTSPDYKKSKVTEEFADQANKAKENAKKPGSVGNVSGPGSQQAENRFATMTDEQIEEHYQKVRFGH